MHRAPRHIRLDDRTSPAGSVRFVSGFQASLAEGRTRSVVTVTRTGTFTDPRYGTFSITREILLGMVRNFDAGVLGQKVFIDLNHDPTKGAAGEIVALAVEGERLRATVEWTPLGLAAIRDRGMVYLSAEYHEAWQDNEQRQTHGPVLLGAALTTRPVIKRLDPVRLSDINPASDRPVLLHPELVRQLSETVRQIVDKHLKWLRKQLAALGLAEAQIKKILASYELAAKSVGEDEDGLKALAESFAGSAKALHTPDDDASRTAPAGAPAGEPGAVSAAVDRALAARAQAAADAAATLEARRALFAAEIEGAQSLSEETRKTLMEARDLVTGEMSEDQVKRFAKQQIALGGQIQAARQLASMGWTGAGSPRISADDQTTIRSLSQCIRDHLRHTPQAQIGAIRLAERDHPFVARVLGEFDRIHAARLDSEHKTLTGSTDTSHTDLPISFQREVIREALSDLQVLGLVQNLTDFSATQTTQIPYEERDVGSIPNDGIVYEGQGIPRAGLEQKMDLAYVLPMKLALRLTNEVMHFTRASAINWDAWGRNIESNARAMRELLARRIGNELLRASDAYQAAAVTSESIAAQLDGSNSTIKTVQFPIVRPFQQRDLRGNAVGSPECPITILFGATPVLMWDGTGTQAAGTYWRITSVNLGYIQFVNAAGTPVTPDEATATISYHRVTNVLKWDTDFDPDDIRLEEHWNGLLRAVGARKAMLRSDRYTEPNFLLMSPALEDAATNAEGFIPLKARAGAAADGDGDLVRIKGIGAVTTNAPGLDLGDERILMSQRGTLSYVIAKPWGVSQPFEAVDSQGRPTGTRVAYGEELNSVHQPVPTRYRSSSVLVYSAAGR